MTGQGGSTMNETLRDDAVTWLVRVQSDQATAEDWAALTTWLEASDDHLKAFEESELLVAELSEQALQIAPGLTLAAPTVTQLRSRAARPAWSALVGIAAAVAALVAGPALWRSYQGAPEVFETGPGQTRQIALADGTHIHLDAASKLTVRLGWRARRLEMAQAQATFDIAKDPTRPFLIGVGDQQVRVVGTEFNIRHFDNTVQVTVRRGIVEVRQPSLGPQPVARLVAGQTLSHVVGAVRSTQARTDPNGAFAWTQGRLVCDDETLGEIIADLNRRYPKPIRVSNATAKRRFSGVLILGDEEVVVQRLAGYFSLSVHRSGGEIELR
jgi:transmembrane sensor